MTPENDPVRRCIEAEIGAGRMPGAAWWVGVRGHCLSRGVAGFATIEPAPVALEASTPFDLASLTKPMCAAVVALLLEQERSIDLASPLVSNFAECGETAFAAKTLTDLAAHTAGFAAWKPLYVDGSGATAYLRSIFAEPPAVGDGATVYSDLGYILLGFALERATGTPLDRLFAERIARPLGLTRAGFASERHRFDDAAATERGNAYERKLAGVRGRGYPFREHLLRGEVHDGNAHGLGGIAGHAGLFATLDETVALAGLWLDGRPIGLSERSRRKLTTPMGDSGSRTFGLHPATTSETVRGALDDDAVGHMGFVGTSAWVEPSRGALYVLLTHRVHPVVPEEPFLPVRRAFHLAARRLTMGA